MKAMSTLICHPVLGVTCFCDPAELLTALAGAGRPRCQLSGNSSCQPCPAKFTAARWRPRQLSMCGIGWEEKEGYPCGYLSAASISRIYLSQFLYLFLSPGVQLGCCVSIAKYSRYVKGVWQAALTPPLSPPSFSFPLLHRHFTSQLLWSAVQPWILCSQYSQDKKGKLTAHCFYITYLRK